MAAKSGSRGQEAPAVLQGTGDAGLSLGGSSGVDSGYILNVSPTEYPAGLNRECERERERERKQGCRHSLGPNNGRSGSEISMKYDRFP